MNFAETQLTASTIGRLQTAWTRDNPVAYYPPLIVGSSTFLTITQSGATPARVDVVSTATGARLWSVDVPDFITPQSLAVANNTLYVSGESRGTDAAVVAVDLRTHEPLWTVHASPTVKGRGNFTAEDLLVDSGVLYLTAGGGNLDAFDALSGRHLWEQPPLVDRTGSPDGIFRVVAGGGKVGYVYSEAGGEQFGFSVHDGRTNKLLWQQVAAEHGQNLYEQLVLVSGRLYVADVAGVRSYAWNGCAATQCRASWSYLFTPSVARYFPEATVDLAGGDSNRMILTVVGPEDTNQARVNRILVLDARNGAMTWSVSSLGNHTDYASAIGSGDLVYAFLDDNLVAYQIGCAGCAPKILTHVDGANHFPSATISVAQGTLLVQGWVPGGVIALRLRTGTTSASLSATRAGSKVQLAGRVLQTSSTGVGVASSGRTVQLQRLVRGNWQRVLNATSDASGYVRVTITQAAATQFRLAVFARSGASAVISPVTRAI